MQAGHNQAYVTILSFEGSQRPFEVTNADMLTQFFTDMNGMRSGVRSFIIAEQDVELITEPNYEKLLVDLKTLVKIVDGVDEEPSSYTGNYSPVTFIFCHGGGRDEKDPEIPAVLNFGENPVHNYVWARDSDFLPFSAVTLYEVIRATNLVFLMCCNGSDIVNDYISEQNECMNEIPEIVMFDCKKVLSVSVAILVGLLIQIIDSVANVTQDPSMEILQQAVKDGIITILNMVNLCEDEFIFWDVLMSLGCISWYRTEKHGLPFTNIFDDGTLNKLYRLSGHTYNASLPPFIKPMIFKDFRALTLISPGIKTKVKRRQNYENVEKLETPTIDVIKEKIRECKSWTTVKPK